MKVDLGKILNLASRIKNGYLDHPELFEDSVKGRESFQELNELLKQLEGQIKLVNEEVDKLIQSSEKINLKGALCLEKVWLLGNIISGFTGNVNEIFSQSELIDEEIDPLVLQKMEQANKCVLDMVKGDLLSGIRGLLLFVKNVDYPR